MKEVNDILYEIQKAWKNRKLNEYLNKEAEIVRKKKGKGYKYIIAMVKSYLITIYDFGYSINTDIYQLSRNQVDLLKKRPELIEIIKAEHIKTEIHFRVDKW